MLTRVRATLSLWPTRRVHEDPSHQHPIHESDISHIVEPTSNISPHHYPHPPIGEQAQVQAPLSHQSDIAKKCLKELRRPTRFRTRLSFAQSSRQIRTSAAQRFDPDDIEGNFARLSENPENVPCRHSAVTLFKPNSPPTARCRSKRKDLFEALGPVGALSEEENIPDEGVVSNLDSEFDIPASAAAAGVGASPAPPSPSPTAAAAARAKAFTGAVEAPLEEENIPNEEFASDLHSDFETAPSSFGVSPPSSPIPADTVAAATAAQASTNIIGSLIAPAVLAVPVTSAVLASSPAASIIVSSPVASTPDHLSGNLPSASFPPGQHTVTSVPSGLPASTRTSLVQTAGASTSIDKAASISSTDNHSGTPRLAQSTTGNTSIDHNTHTPHPAQSTSGDTSIYRHTDTPLPAQSATGVTSTEQALSFSSPDHHRGSPRLAQGTTEDTSINHHTVTATQIAASTATSTSNDQNFALTNSSSSSAAPLATGSSPKPKWPKRRRSSHTTPVPRKRQRTTYFIPPTREGAFVLSPVAEETASAVKKANLDTISEPDNFGYQGEDTPAERRAYSEPPEFDPMDLDDESYRASFAPLAESPSGGSQEPYGARHPLAAPKPRRKGKGAGDATYTPAGSNTGAQLSGDESDYDILVPESEKKGLAFDFAQEKARRLAQADHHTDDFWSHAEQDLHARISMRGYEALLPEHWQFDFRTLPDSLFGKADDGEPLIRATGGSELHAVKSLASLFALGGWVRDCSILKIRPETVIRRGLRNYLRWAARDSRVRTADAMPVHTVYRQRKGESTLSAVRKLDQRLKGLARQYAGNPHCPLLTGFVICGPICAILTLDPNSVSDGMGSQDTASTFMCQLDMSDHGQDVWNSLALAIVVAHVRDMMAGLAAQGAGGFRFVDGEDEGEDEDL